MTRLLENKLLEKMVFDLTKRWFELRRKLSEADPRHCSAVLTKQEIPSPALILLQTACENLNV